MPDVPDTPITSAASRLRGHDPDACSFLRCQACDLVLSMEREASLPACTHAPDDLHDDCFSCGFCFAVRLLRHGSPDA